MTYDKYKFSEVKGRAKEPQRVIFNIETKEVKKEFERMKKAGATVIKKPYDMEGGWIAHFPILTGTASSS